ncbi:MAG: FliA/WhiG family RNA polymerase sigma factor [Deltaproteobacteria bacterium]|nr:FliA/WhiG family RNA polymerase sigma factor [Deltaproteobacteria bacterium]
MDEKTAYMEKYAPLIKFIAERLAARLPDHIAKEDLMSSGALGLIDAIDKFQPERGILFKTYAEFRIKGAMLDELRHLDWVPRTIRKKVSELEKLWKKLEWDLGHPPSDEECAESLGISIQDYLKMLDDVSVISVLDLEAYRSEKIESNFEELDIYEILEDQNNQDALTILGQEELRRVLAQGIDLLPEKERLVVTLYYHEDLTMREIGQVMGYTESRISQLHTQSVIKLRVHLTDYFNGFSKDSEKSETTGKSAKKSKLPKGTKKPTDEKNLAAQSLPNQINQSQGTSPQAPPVETIQGSLKESSEDRGSSEEFPQTTQTPPGSLEGSGLEDLESQVNLSQVLAVESSSELSLHSSEVSAESSSVVSVGSSSEVSVESSSVGNFTENTSEPEAVLETSPKVEP